MNKYTGFIIKVQGCLCKLPGFHSLLLVGDDRPHGQEVLFGQSSHMLNAWTNYIGFYDCSDIQHLISI
jgi:hypothetical protein